MELSPTAWVSIVISVVLVLGAVLWYVWGRNRSTPSSPSTRRTTTPSSTGNSPSPGAEWPTKTAQYVSLKRVSDSADGDTSLNAKRSLNVGTIVVFGVVNGSIVPLVPIRVTSTLRHLDLQIWDAGNVTDGNPNTIFHSDLSASADNTNPWITLDFGSAQAIHRVVITPRIGYDVRMVGTQLQLGSAASTPEIVYARNLSTAAPFYEFIVEGTGDAASGPFRK